MKNFDVTMTMLSNQLRKTHAKDLELKKPKSELISKQFQKKEKSSHCNLCCLPTKKKVTKEDTEKKYEEIEKRDAKMEDQKKLARTQAIEEIKEMILKKRADKELKMVGKLLLRRTYMGKEIYLCYK
jgi:hypothetical protein